MSKKVSITYEFVVPADGVLASARKMATSSNQDEKTVGGAVVELTDIINRTKAAIEDTVSNDTYDLGVYFDYQFGDTLEAAKRLKTSPDKEVRYVADTLISQSEAITKSKTAFLAAVKA